MIKMNPLFLPILYFYLCPYFFTLNVVRTVRICMCIYYIFIDPLDLNLYIFQYYLYIYGIYKCMYFYSHTFEEYM